MLPLSTLALLNSNLIYQPLKPPSTHHPIPQSLPRSFRQVKMKSSLAITLASAAASLAGPLQTRRTKMPFIEPNPACDNGPAYRPNLPEDSEGCLGTLYYCTKRYYQDFGEHHDSPKANKAVIKCVHAAAAA